MLQIVPGNQIYPLVLILPNGISTARLEILCHGETSRFLIKNVVEAFGRCFESEHWRPDLLFYAVKRLLNSAFDFVAYKFDLRGLFRLGKNSRSVKNIDEHFKHDYTSIETERN